MTYNKKVSLHNLQTAMINSNRAFASYRLPGAENPVTIIGETDFSEIYSIAEVLKSGNGFLMAPFSAGKPYYWLKAGEVLEGNYVHTNLLSSFQQRISKFEDTDIHIVDKEAYLEKIKETIRKIGDGEVGKVVISRQIKTEWHGASHQVGHLFEYLCSIYPDVFVYVANLPGKGTWIGATPEMLLKSNQGKIKTMSLSSTRKKQEVDSEWGKKELEEHWFVTRYIEDILEKSGCRNLEITPTHTVGAGGIEHLRTGYSAECEVDSLPSLVQALHPTPAICGWPTPAAQKFIAEIENYDRTFYTGFLGPVNDHSDFSFFVNLRCMEIRNNEAVIYVGGGITIDSDPESEWMETELKSRTMLGAIEKLPNFVR